MTTGSKGYAGDSDPAVTYRTLADDKAAQLIDVRTKGEWERVGVPDLADIGKQPIFLEWQVAPAMQVAPDFLDKLGVELAARGLDKDTPLYFLCRSGARSAAAARAATAAGFAASHNVAEGFEGPADMPAGQPVGWRRRGLPNRQP